MNGYKSIAEGAQTLHDDAEERLQRDWVDEAHYILDVLRAVTLQYQAFVNETPGDNRFHQKLIDKAYAINDEFANLP